MIMRNDGKMADNELEFFLKGNTSLSETDAKPESLSWMTESGWNDLQMIHKVHQNLHGLKASVIENCEVGRLLFLSVCNSVLLHINGF